MAVEPVTEVAALVGEVPAELDEVPARPVGLDAGFSGEHGVPSCGVVVMYRTSDPVFPDAFSFIETHCLCQCKVSRQRRTVH
jgi:hypothetical protein